MPLTPSSGGDLRKLPREHVWVEMWLVPVEVLVDPETDEPMVVRKQSEIANADANAKIGCLACNVSLDEGFNTDCVGP